MKAPIHKSRIEDDIRIRAYYSKYIFNSHFLIFLTIAGGVFLYSLLGMLSAMEPNIYLDIIAALLMSIVLLPKYRSLLKEADVLFLPPYEKYMKTYFSYMNRYSFWLSAYLPITGLIISLLLLRVGHPGWVMVLFVGMSVLLYIFAFLIRRDAVNTPMDRNSVILMLILIHFISLFSILVNPLFILLGLLLIGGLYFLVQKKQHKNLDWPKIIDHEASMKQKYYQYVSMFTNVRLSSKQYKRRKYFDALLKQPPPGRFNKNHMYEYLFRRTFLRDDDLPMIILRLLMIFSIVIIWVDAPVLSVIVLLFALYVIVLQMSQLYTAQAYLLWPKVWPVEREYIQESYIRFSHKVILMIALLLAVIFIFLHPVYFYIAAVFPLWGFALNSYFSKNVYKKERLLSD
ncbi:ABC transporter permease [Lacicoccus alkaliphilus]|uniref:ABC-2 type transport system permease protein n=1 Tax=Lacicoccus alkaliphilus DSM 16010 TaxID=1123231 RepID=A0A1M7A970_9BACL|nr:ABC transporter permease [Salinicoccus alkaliphilus]SHL39188.1 ABC-2 type transport system permease protein [Salinicoccus alkaliphilus DSM 16010]